MFVVDALESVNPPVNVLPCITLYSEPELNVNNPTDSYTNILTRNLIFTRVEKVIMAIYGMSLNKNETPEEMAKRFEMNSNK